MIQLLTVFSAQPITPADGYEPPLSSVVRLPDETMDIEEKLPDLKGKVVLVYFIGRRDHDGTVIQKPSFERQGGRLFLCGPVLEGTTVNDWILGVKTCVAWDQIEEYLVFDSPADYHSRVEKGRAPTSVQ